MARNQSHYICQECGSVYSKWMGKCESCGSWDSIYEEQPQSSFSTLPANTQGHALTFESLNGQTEEAPRLSSLIGEMDRVLGGGLVKGSAILVGGDPGIGKSTLLLQLVAGLSQTGVETAYISGEESVNQVRLRAKRLGLQQSSVHLLSATNIRDILATLDQHKRIQLLIIDSIQTMFMDNMQSAPGTVSQVRAAAHELIRMTKERNIILLLVGHVTKDGQIAGPKVLEHMVDTVLYFEGERGHPFRILRAVKNRFGCVNEIGVFEMSDVGLREVLNPSALFLSQRRASVTGSAVFAGIEGTRPMLMEIQALVSPSYLPTPRRASVGWDNNRLAMLVAVLTTRYGLPLADKEIYLNVAGGIKVIEPGADLAVACALISSVTSVPLPAESILFGEIGLAGEIRMVGHADIRLKEAAKLGFTKAIIPAGSKYTASSLSVTELHHIKELKDLFVRPKVNTL